MSINLTNSLRVEESTLIERMIRYYCQHRHATPHGQLCAECEGLLTYARQRIAHCHYGDDKPTCRKCPVHCYSPNKREQIKEVMKFAGPRMLAHGDLAALKHLLRE